MQEKAFCIEEQLEQRKEHMEDICKFYEPESSVRLEKKLSNKQNKQLEPKHAKHIGVNK